MRAKLALALVTLGALSACDSGPRIPEGATLLYDLRFSAPDNSVGKPPKTHTPDTDLLFPSKVVTNIFMGQPQVVDSLCGLDDQPLRLATASGTQGHEGIELLLDGRYAQYRIELDVCVAAWASPPLQANEPQLGVYLDIPQAYAVGFFDKGRLVAMEPPRGLEAITQPKVIGAYELGKPVHLALDVDVDKQSWSVAVDGKPSFEGSLPGVLPRAVRVVLRGNVRNVVALDNVAISASKLMDEGEGLLEEPSANPEVEQPEVVEPEVEEPETEEPAGEEPATPEATP